MSLSIYRNRHAWKLILRGLNRYIKCRTMRELKIPLFVNITIGNCNVKRFDSVWINNVQQSQPGDQTRDVKSGTTGTFGRLYLIIKPDTWKITYKQMSEFGVPPINFHRQNIRRIHIKGTFFNCQKQPLNAHFWGLRKLRRLCDELCQTFGTVKCGTTGQLERIYLLLDQDPLETDPMSSNQIPIINGSLNINMHLKLA